MNKLFLTLTLMLTLLTTTVFAAENSDENKVEPYEYTSEVYGFKIMCPSKPAVVVKPFEDPNKKGELLVFANDGMKVLFGYVIELDAFDDKKVPNFNRDKKKIIDSYLEKIRQDNAYTYAEVVEIAPNNKGFVLVTAKEIEVKDENGEVEGTLTADQQTAFAHFRSRSGRCITIQLISASLDESDYNDYRKSVATFQDATDLSMPPADNNNDKKSKKKKK